MSRLHHVSASQITTFRACKRLWAIEKLAEITRAKAVGGPLDIGTQVHEMIEEYLLTGLRPGSHIHGTKFDAVLKYLPPPAPQNPGLLVEYEFDFPVYPGGTTIVGGIDIALPPWMEPDGNGGTLWVAGVDDHKTTSDLKYAKTPEELKTNTQLIIYAYFLFNMKRLIGWNLVPWEAWRPVWEDGLDRVRIRHNYIKTRNVVRAGQAQQVEVYLTWEHVAKEWAKIISDVKEMEQLADVLWDNVHAIQNEPARIDYLIQLVEGDQNDGARCHMFNGCDHKGRCPEANSLVALTRGPADFKLEPEYANLFANAPQMEETKMENGNDDLSARLAAKMAARTAVATPPPAPAARAPEPVLTSSPTAVLPPDAPPRETSAADLEAPPAGPNPTSAAAPADAAPEAPKKRRSRAKSAPAAAPTPSTPEVTNAPQATAQAETATPPTAPATDTPQDTARAFGGQPAARLYIGCRPLVGPDAGCDPLAFEKWIAGVKAALRAETGAPHYRLLKYGAGFGALATVMEARFAELPEVVCVPARGTPEGDEFLALALPKALVVVG